MNISAIYLVDAVNNWNYIKYNPVIPYYIINNYVLIYHDQYDIYDLGKTSSSFRVLS